MLCFVIISYNQQITVAENDSVVFEVHFPDCDVEAVFFPISGKQLFYNCKTCLLELFFLGYSFL